MSTAGTSPSSPTADGPGAPASSSPALLTFSWMLVGVPLAYGVWQTLVKAAKLFTG